MAIEVAKNINDTREKKRTLLQIVSVCVCVCERERERERERVRSLRNKGKFLHLKIIKHIVTEKHNENFYSHLNIRGET